MFRQLVKQLYIGKSKLKVYPPIQEFQIDPTTEIQDLGPVEIHYQVTPDRQPDLYLNGDFTSGNSFTLNYRNHGLHNMYVTGIPKESENLDNFRLEGCLWSSYFEDDHRGYLFQILNSEQPIVNLLK